MAKQTVNIGANPNDTNGDPLRTAFTKTNENFDEVYGVDGLLLSDGAGNLTAGTPGTDYVAPTPSLLALAGLTPAANKGLYFDDTDSAALYDLSAFIRSFGASADAEAAQSALGLVIGTHVIAPSASLTAVKALTPAANKGLYFDNTDSAALYDLSAFGRSLSGAADAEAAQSTLGLVIGTHVIAPSASLTAVKALTPAANKGLYFDDTDSAALYDLSAFARSFSASADAEAAQSALGLVIGTHVIAPSLSLTAVKALTPAANKGLYFNGTESAALYDLSAFGRSLAGSADAAAARTTLGLTAGLKFAQTADGTCANTITETTITSTGSGSLTIDPSTWAVGQVYRFTARGYHSTATGGGTYGLKFYLGSTVIGQAVATYINTSAVNCAWEFVIEFTVRSIGASGTVIAFGRNERFTGATTPTMVQVVGTTINSTTTLDMSVSQTASLKATWSAAVSGHSITCTSAVLQQL